MTKTKTSADLEKDIEMHEARIRKLTEEKKILNRKKAEQLRRERTHQLCTRGGMVNAFLKEPKDFYYGHWKVCKDLSGMIMSSRSVIAYGKILRNTRWRTTT